MSRTHRQQHSQARHPRGFTIIELMIVLTLISVLTVVAVPTYLRFAVRTQVAEGINLIKPFRYAINDYYIQNGSWPPSNLSAGMRPPQEYATHNIDSITITPNGDSVSITIDYSIPALGDDDTLIFYTALDNGHIRWYCDFGTVDDRFRPAACISE